MVSKQIVATPMKIDTTFRPVSYFWPQSLETKLLSTVKGAERQNLIRELIKDGKLKDVPEWMTSESLSDADRVAAGQVHPRYMGGEYLPSLRGNEVEIARISLESTTGDVISVRARRGKYRICYRVVDEYGNEGLTKPTRQSSVRPLTLAQVEQLIEESDAGMGYIRFNLENGGDAESLSHFLHATSPFYPELARLYQQRVDAYLASMETNADPVAQPDGLLDQVPEASADELGSEEQSADSDDGGAHPCLICGASTQDECGHLVASYDVGCGELVWGELYQSFDNLVQQLRDEFLHAVKHKAFRFQVSDDIKLFAAQLNENSSSEEIEEVLAKDRFLFKQQIIDRLMAMPDVVVDEWDSDAMGPGTATVIMDFWAENPKAVVATLSADFTIGMTSGKGLQRGNLLSKHRGYNPDSPIYKLGFQVGSRSLASPSPSTQESSVAQPDPMAPVAQGIEDWLAEKHSTETHPPVQSKP